jgi:hypothetical protein
VHFPHLREWKRKEVKGVAALFPPNPSGEEIKKLVEIIRSAAKDVQEKEIKMDD